MSTSPHSPPRAPLGGTTRRDWVVLLVVLAIGSAIYAGTKDSQGRYGGVAELDGYYYYIYLRSLQRRGEIDFHDEYRHWGNPFGYGDTPTGMARNVFGIGPAIVWSPFFMVAQTAAVVGRGLGFAISRDSLSRFHQRITLYGSLFYGWLALVLCYLICRHLFGQRWALLAALGAGLAGPLPYYCLTGASYSHAPAAMAASLMVWLWICYRDRWTARRWIAFGAATGLCLLVRPATAALLLIPISQGLRQLWPALRSRTWRSAAHALWLPLYGALAACIVFFPQLLAWRILYGSWLTIPQGEGFMWWGQPAWAATLFAPRNGLFPSAPLLLFAVIGLFGAWRARTRGAAIMLATLALVALLNGVVHDWWGWNFSARRYTHTLPLMAIGLAYAIGWLASRIAKNPARATAAVVVGAVAAFCLFNLEWMHQFRAKNLQWYSVRSTEGLYMTVAHGLVKKVYRTAGNPFGLPAALAFSWEHGATPLIYDQVEGSYVLGETNPRTLPAADSYLHALLPLYEARLRPHLSPSFGAPGRDDTGIRYVPLRDRYGHVLLPINRPGTLELWLRARAVWPNTRLELRLGDIPIATFTLNGRWQTIYAKVPARHVRRGVNRLELWHQPPAEWSAAGSRLIGRTGQKSPVDLAVASGGLAYGRFCDVWVRERRFECGRGLTIVVLDRRSGRVLGRRTSDAHIHPAAYDELSHYLAYFPRGSIVALGVRDNVGRHFGSGGKALLALLGATTDLSRSPKAGYAAIGVLGAPLGSAIEDVQTRHHARARVGRKPPTWRELARYSAIRLR